MTSAERAKEIVVSLIDDMLPRDGVTVGFGERWAALIAAAITQAQNDKLEEAARIVERVTHAQAQGWREHPKEDGCGGAIAVSNGGLFAAEAIRNLISQKD